MEIKCPKCLDTKFKEIYPPRQKLMTAKGIIDYRIHSAFLECQTCFSRWDEYEIIFDENDNVIDIKFIK